MSDEKDEKYVMIKKMDYERLKMKAIYADRVAEQLGISRWKWEPPENIVQHKRKDSGF